MKNISIADAARSMRSVGLNVAPCTEYKAPNLEAWTEYQSILVPNDVLAERFASPKTKGVGVICGKISGNLEVIDIDTKFDLTGTLYQDLCDSIKDVYPDLFDKIVVGRSRSGGAHFYYKSNVIAGNRKLAYRPATKTELAEKPNIKKICLIETRGEGGFIVTAPTEGYTIEQGDLCKIPTISKKERDSLFSFCRSFNTYVELQPKSRISSENNFSLSESPLDSYNESGDILRELQSKGWAVKSVGGKYHLRANSKAGAPHGTYRDGVLYFFSPNVGFTEETGYSAVQAFALLNGYGDDKAGNVDFKKVAYDLAKKGFGKLREKVEVLPKKKEGVNPPKVDDKPKNDLDELVESLRLKREAEEILASISNDNDDLYKNTPFISEDVYSTLPMFFQRLLQGLDGRIRDMAFVYLLGLVSGCFKNLKVRHSGDQVPVLFTYVIAPPSSGKNICTKMHRVILGIHKKRKDEYEAEKQDWEARRNLAKTAKPPQPFDEQPPPEKKLWQTANMSAAAFSQALMNNNLVISDSEGNTLANCLKQEWGGMIDLLCKIYHQEAAGISRAGKEQVECENPTASLALSSTPSQVSGIIKEEGDGLVSRFSFYRFSEEFSFKWPGLYKKEIVESEWDSRIRRAQNTLLEMDTFKEAVMVLSKEQMEAGQKIGKGLENYARIVKSDNIAQIIARGAVQLVRIAAVLENFSRYDKFSNDRGEGWDGSFNFTISTKNFENAAKIFDVLFSCNIKMYAEIADSQPIKKKASSGQVMGKMVIYEDLPNEFTTTKAGDLEKVCEKHDVRPPTAKRWVTSWAKAGLIEKIKQGRYKKLQ